MNIFYLDHDPQVAATLMCDQHINKMILESAQLLCTTVHVLYGTNSPPCTQLYKPTHQNHPCSIWLRESKANCDWLYDHARCLNNERFHRFDSTQDHQSMMVAAQAMYCLDRLPPEAWQHKDYSKTQPVQAMPTTCWFPEDSAVAYQNYYNLKNKQWIDDKRLANTGPGAMKWSNRSKPSFMFT